jgi:polyisoprenyl-phosphate glycosyltransferase
LTKLLEYASRYPFITILDFSRNFGHQIAVTAGLDQADADYVAIIDADMQDPPELIEDMYHRAKLGVDIVYGKRLSRKGEALFKRLTARMFYRFISRMCDVEIPEDTGDFRLISRRVLNSVQLMRERHRFLRGMIPWVGFSNEPFLYNRDERYAGETKYPLKKMVKFALDAIFSFSNTPIRIATFTGVVIFCIGLILGLLLIYLRIFTQYTVPGITATILTIIVIGGVQIIMLGVVGEYIGRIFEESKNRPLYILKRVVNPK